MGGFAFLSHGALCQRIHQRLEMIFVVTTELR